MFLNLRVSGTFGSVKTKYIIPSVKSKAGQPDRQTESKGKARVSGFDRHVGRGS